MLYYTLCAPVKAIVNTRSRASDPSDFIHLHAMGGGGAGYSRVAVVVVRVDVARLDRLAKAPQLARRPATDTQGGHVCEILKNHDFLGFPREAKLSFYQISLKPAVQI